MTIEITPGVVGAVCAGLSLVFGAGLAIGDLRYYRRKEGTDLERVVAGLTEIVNRANDDRKGFQRLHERMDEFSAALNRLLGWMERQKP